MNDLLPPDSAKWRHFEDKAKGLFELYGYQEIRTPIVESTDLFSRGIGEATDVVEKEMYTFQDRGDRSLTMRPEGTASTVRAYIQHGLSKLEPVTRLYYTGPMFRYERMQTGRYRQFYQMGVEAFGVAEPTMEAEQMAMLHHLYSELGVGGLTMLINSVGNAEDRPVYRKVLVEYLRPHADALCANCRRRLESNPLRVLDCKVPSCKEIAVDAPSVLDHLGERSLGQFEGAKAALDSLGVPYQIDHRMVRGLDYYTGTVFELVSSSAALGTQSTLAAGGRYDTLVSSLGGPAVPAVGFALGVERAILSLEGEGADFAPRPALFLAARGDAARGKAIELAGKLRLAGHFVEVDHREVGLKAQFKRADKLRAIRVVAIGDDELASGVVSVRDMATREETEVGIDELASVLG
jgi:histidyl-tRNA synthetase